MTTISKIRRPAPRSLPKEAKMLGDMYNLYKVPENQIKKILEKVEANASTISDNFLSSIVTSFLGYDQAMTYSQVALRDGAGIDIEVETDVENLIGWVCRLSLMYHVIKMQPLPNTYKSLIFKSMIKHGMEKAFSSRSGGALGELRSLQQTDLTGQVVRSRVPGKQREILTTKRNRGPVK